MSIADRCRAGYRRVFPPGTSRMRRLAAFAVTVFVLYLLIGNYVLNTQMNKALDDVKRLGDSLHSQQAQQLQREDTLLLGIALLEQQVNELCAHRPTGATPCKPVTVPTVAPLPGEAPGPATGGSSVRGGGSPQPNGGGSSSSPKPHSSPSSRPSSHPTRPPLACVLGTCISNPLPTLTPLGAPDAGRQRAVSDARQPTFQDVAVSRSHRHRGDPSTGPGGYAAAGIGLLLVGLIRSKVRARAGVQRQPPA